MATAQQNLCRFNLDFQGMTVRSVRVDGPKARWARSQDHELTVTPAHRLKKGRRFTTVVRYDGVPRTQVDLSVPEEPLPYGWIHTDDGAVVASEPEGSANWFPLNDHPTDKAAFTFVVTVPAGLEAISNGRLVGRRTHDHRTTWVWDAPDPMAPYLATATIGQFDLRSYRTAQGLRMYDAVDPDLYGEPSTATSWWYTRTPTSGSVTASPWPSGSTCGSTRASPPTPIGCGASARGLGTTQEVFDFFYGDIPADDPFWDVVIGDPGIPFLFNDAVYTRGAMTLQVLRNQVGDRDFFRILRTWAQRKAGGNGTTGQFIALAERISGEQLDALFDAWLFTPAKPALPTAMATGATARVPATAASAPRTPGRGHPAQAHVER